MLLSLWSKEGLWLSLQAPTLLAAAVVQTLHVVSIQHPPPPPQIPALSANMILGHRQK